MKLETITVKTVLFQNEPYGTRGLYGLASPAAWPYTLCSPPESSDAQGDRPQRTDPGRD